MNRNFRWSKSKYGAKPTKVEGIRFDSKKEAHYFAKLQSLQRSGEVSYFLRQVPLDLPGNTRLRIDFVVFYTDGRVEYVDVKGYMTPMAKMKIKQVEDLYPIEIKIV